MNDTVYLVEVTGGDYDSLFSFIDSVWQIESEAESRAAEINGKYLMGDRYCISAEVLKYGLGELSETKYYNTGKQAKKAAEENWKRRQYEARRTYEALREPGE